MHDRGDSGCVLGDHGAVYVEAREGAGLKCGTDMCPFVGNDGVVSGVDRVSE